MQTTTYQLWFPTEVMFAADPKAKQAAISSVLVEQAVNCWLRNSFILNACTKKINMI